MNAIIAATLAKIATWGIEKLASIALKFVKKYLKNKQIDENVDLEVAQVNKAVHEAKEALDSCEGCKRVPSKTEQKLREATRRLTNNLLG